MLGTLTKPFQISDMLQLLQKANTLDKLQLVKDYILSYFGHCIASIGVIMWCPDKRTFKLRTDVEAKRLIRKDIISIQIPGSKKPIAIDIQNWFFHQHDTLYDLDCDQTKPLVYEDKGRKHINLFPGYLHKEVYKFSEYSQDIQDSVHLILKHIRNVW
jgi:hypothetical protein